MKLIFMGTPEFALPSLDALAESQHDILAVVTQQDRPKGRRLILTPPAVKRRAIELGLKVLQPVSLTDTGFMDQIGEVGPELIVVVAYGNYLPRALWGLPRYGTINLHPSLLPKYRGAAPIPRAILKGETETGVTILYIGDGLDSGDIIAQEKVPIPPAATSESLGSRLAEAGGRLLLEAVRDIEMGSAARTPQDGENATLAPKVSKSEGLIDWNLSAVDLALRVRAFYPWPGASTYFTAHDKRMLLKVIEADVDTEGTGSPGLVAGCDGRGLHIGAGKGCLILKTVQPEGKGRMAAAQFAAGRRDLVGMKLG
ncbi:MAG: methionyl-tRNA formyltransferase [bacterium]